MPYYVTIYIHPMNFNIPHTFLGLTRKHLDELDTLKFERETKKQIWDFKLGKMVYLKEEIKWYELKETNEFNDGFWGFGPGGNWYDVGVFTRVIGKVFENNQYIVNHNIKQIPTT